MRDNVAGDQVCMERAVVKDRVIYILYCMYSSYFVRSSTLTTEYVSVLCRNKYSPQGVSFVVVRVHTRVRYIEHADNLQLEIWIRLLCLAMVPTYLDYLDNVEQTHF